jgi:hypothetical protein
MYSDPIRGEPRQYDFSFEIGRGALAVRLAIECKNVFKLWDDWFPDEALEAGFRSGFRAVDW